MLISIVYQPDADTTHWCALYLKGARAEVKRKGDTLALLSLEEALVRFSEDKPTCAAILSTSRAWAATAANALSAIGVEPVIIGGASRDNYRHASYVYMDYREATYQLVEYLHRYNRARIALFAVSTDSATDMIKRDAFLACDQCREQDVFYYTGADGLMAATCENFLAVCQSYDAVICTNDAGAVILMHQLTVAGIRIPEDLFLCTFGDMSISTCGSKSLTMARLNCPEIGKQTVAMCRLLTASEDISGISTKIRCELVIGDTTASLPILENALGTVHMPNGGPSDFHKDPSVSRIFQAEKILSACDALDIDLLKLIIRGYRYFDIAEILHVSESTVKYRLKRIISISGFETRDEIIEVMRMFLT